MKRTKRFLGLALASLMAVASFAGCSSETTTSDSADSSSDSSTSSTEESGEETLKIGGTFTLTGDLAHSGTLAYEGALAAIDYVNNELGGVNGMQVELVYYDDEFDSGKIPSLYEKLISVDEVDLLVSPYTSALLDAAPTVNQYDSIMFSVGADSYSANTEYGTDIVNIQMDDVWQGGMWWKDVAEFLATSENEGVETPQTVAIVNLETTYGHEVNDALTEYFTENGIEIVYEEYFDPGVADWTSCITKLKAVAPDAVIVPHYFEDSVTFVQACQSMDFSADYMVIEGMGWDSASWVNPDNGGLDPSISKMNFISYSVYKSTRECESTVYAAEYCSENYNSVPGNDFLCGFMAVELACKAAIEAGSTDKEDLIEVLQSNLFELAGYDYQMNETGGNCADFSWGVGQYQPEDLSSADTSGDDWEVLWPEEYKTADANLPFQGW
ncbi:MAG: ABC transporter substrate-binding protein [Clostridia bacterium]